MGQTAMQNEGGPFHPPRLKAAALEIDAVVFTTTGGETRSGKSQRTRRTL